MTCPAPECKFLLHPPFSSSPSAFLSSYLFSCRLDSPKGQICWARAHSCRLEWLPLSPLAGIVPASPDFILFFAGADPACFGARRPSRTACDVSFLLLATFPPPADGFRSLKSQDRLTSLLYFPVFFFAFLEWVFQPRCSQSRFFFFVLLSQTKSDKSNLACARAPSPVVGRAL